jgi:hypothetical protein
MFGSGWGFIPNLQNNNQEKKSDIPTCSLVFCLKCGCHYSDGICSTHGKEFVIESYLNESKRTY